MTGNQQALALGELEAAAVVAHVKRTIRPDGEPIRAATRLGDGLRLLVRFDAGNSASSDFDDNHRAVVHRHRPLRKFQSRSDFTNCHRMSLG